MIETFRMNRIAVLLSLATVAAALAACTGTPQENSALATGSSAATRSVRVPAPAPRSISLRRPNHRKSWISADAKRAPRLLFISDYGADDVDIFTMPKMALKGQITGLSFPEGECADASGNIWVANTGASAMQLYSRTGTLLKTLSVAGEYPSGCAVNKSNGDLAVTNIENTSGGPGNVTVFAHASGVGTPYTNPSLYLYFFVGYNNAGDLFFDGMDSSRITSYFAELPSGSGSTRLITLSGATLHVPGMIQLYRPFGYLALGDQACGGNPASCIYLVSIYGTTGTTTRGRVMKTTDLSNYEGGAVCDLAQGVIAGNGEQYLAGADYESCGYTASTANRWAYDSGGIPVEYNNGAGLVEPLGAAVSTK
ncbi:MAG TPA: hypothetical protein VHT92_08605 [Candidatus Cybelea sp.]|jgi:hypothetical protein|nr:hypothetical protein [Candidatus Cybelea sp.]